MPATNPSQSRSTFSSHLRECLQSTPITPLLDIFAAALSTSVLIFRGVPIRTAVQAYPHILSSRHDTNDPKAQIRLLFSLVWTTIPILSDTRRAPRELLGIKFASLDNWLMFWANVLSLIALATPFVTWHRLNKQPLNHGDIKAMLAVHGISTQPVERIHCWKSTGSIWLHLLVVLFPFRRLVLVVVHSPWDIFWWIWLFSTWYLKAAIKLSIAFLFSITCVELTASLVYHASQHYLHSSWLLREFGGSMAQGSVGRGIAVSCLYGGIVSLTPFGHYSISIWSISDVIVWAFMKSLEEHSKSSDIQMYRERILNDEKRMMREERRREEREEEEIIAKTWLDEIVEANKLDDGSDFGNLGGQDSRKEEFSGTAVDADDLWQQAADSPLDDDMGK